MKIFMLLSCGLLLLLCQRVTAQKNLVSNGGFEDGLNDWNGSSNAKITPWDLKAGKGSCAIIVSSNANWVGIDQMGWVPKNVLGMEFSAWIKTNNVVKGQNEWTGAIYSIEFFDRYDKKIGEGENLARLTGDNEWAQFKKAVKVPVGAVGFKILLAMGYASGAMLVDEVSARVLNAEEVVKL
jgi:hypothetical protein